MTYMYIYMGMCELKNQLLTWVVLWHQITVMLLIVNLEIGPYPGVQHELRLCVLEVHSAKLLILNAPSANIASNQHDQHQWFFRESPNVMGDSPYTEQKSPHTDVSV